MPRKFDPITGKFTEWKARRYQICPGDGTFYDFYVIYKTGLRIISRHLTNTPSRQSKYTKKVIYAATVQIERTPNDIQAIGQAMQKAIEEYYVT